MSDVRRVPSISPPLQGFLRWLEDVPRLLPETCKTYGVDVRMWGKFCAENGLDWQQPTEADVELWIKDAARLGRSAGTVLGRMAALRRFYAWGIKTGAVLSVPDWSEIVTPKPRKRLPRPAKHDHIMELVESIPTDDPMGLRDRAMILVTYASGMRNSEVAGLAISDLDFDAGLVRVQRGKGDKERIVPLGPCGEAVADWIERGRPECYPTHALVFCTRVGSPLHRNHAALMLRSRCADAGLQARITPHMLRHAYATGMIAGDADVVSVSRALGHASIQTTMGYVEITTQQLTEAVDNHHPLNRVAS